MQLPFLYRWHPELALRYLPMVAAIKRANCHTVAEIGSGGLGITPYLKRPVTGFDLGFSPPIHPQLLPVIGNGRCLPLPSHSLDAVICSDMLEHVSPKDRQAVITELARVAQKLIIIGVPVGEGAHQQDQVLDELYAKTHGHRHHFLEEQTGYGVPTKEQMIAMIRNALGATSYKLAILPNLNLTLREFLMRGWISRQPLVNLFHRKLLLLALPFLIPIAHRKPTYRQIFVIRLKTA